MLLAGAGLTCTIAYDFWTSETQDWTRLTSFGFCFGLITVGLMWLRVGSAATIARPITVERSSVINLARIDLSRNDSFPVNDLGQLSAAGWCLALMSVATVLGVIIPGVMLFCDDSVPGKTTNWPMTLCLQAHLGSVWSSTKVEKGFSGGAVSPFDPRA